MPLPQTTGNKTIAFRAQPAVHEALAFLCTTTCFEPGALLASLILREARKVRGDEGCIPLAVPVGGAVVPVSVDPLVFAPPIFLEEAKEDSAKTEELGKKRKARALKTPKTGTAAYTAAVEAFLKGNGPDPRAPEQATPDPWVRLHASLVRFMVPTPMMLRAYEGNADRARIKEAEAVIVHAGRVPVETREEVLRLHQLLLEFEFPGLLQDEGARKVASGEKGVGWIAEFLNATP